MGFCEFKCIKCNFKTKEGSMCFKHQKFHQICKNYIFSCGFCCLKFNNYSILKKHTYNNHYKETKKQIKNVQKFKCQYCVHESDSIYLACTHL